MRFADRPCPMHQHQAGAKPVEEGLSGFWQMSAAFNGSPHANPRSSATRFIGKRANSPSGGNRPPHSRANSVRSHANRAPRLNCRGAPCRSAHKTKTKTKFQFDLQENCDWGSLDKLHLAQNGDFSPQTRGFARKTPSLRAPNRPQSQFSCKLVRKFVAAAGQRANPRAN